MTERFLGIDLGSGSLKATVIDGRGEVIDAASASLMTSYRHPGWAEQDPKEWIAAMCSALKCLAEKGSLQGVAAAAVSSGTHIVVLVDEKGEILRPAILWSDQRSAAESAELVRLYGKRILQVGYQKANPTWTLPQLLWLRRHEPEIVSRVHRVYLAKDYLRFFLTGRWETDYVDAAGTLMLDMAANAWSPELAEMIGWDLSTMPPIGSPFTLAGTVTPQAATMTGLAEGTPFVMGASDSSVEMLTAGAAETGLAAIKLATAGVVAVVSEKAHPHADLLNYRHIDPDYWYVVAATNSCASAHRWLQENLVTGHDGFVELDRIAASVEPGAEGLIFHPFLNGERSPYWDTQLRAGFLGMSMRHGHAHFVRALYEGIGFSLLDCLNSLPKQLGALREARIIGGGARSAVWRQIIADIFRIRVVWPENDDASFGTALLAAVGIGQFPFVRDAVRTCVRFRKVCEPNDAAAEVYASRYSFYCETVKALQPLYRKYTVA